MRIRCGLVFLFVSLLYNISFAQNFFPDSLLILVNNSSGKQKVDALNKLSRELVDYDNKKIYKAANEALVISQKVNYLKGEGEALLNIGIFYSLLDKKDSARISFQNAISKLSTIDDSTYLIYANVEMAMLEVKKNNLKGELDILNNAYQYAINKTDTILEAFVLSHLGNYYTYIQKYDNALVCIEKAVLCYSRLGYTNRIIDCLIRKAIILYRKKSMMPSYKTASYALDLARKNKLPYAELKCNNFLYSYYYQSANYKSALTTHVNITQIENLIRGFENKKIVEEKNMESASLKKAWTDSIKNSIAQKNKEYSLKQSDSDQEYNNLVKLFIYLSAFTILLILIAFILFWKGNQKIKRQSVTIKKLESDLFLKHSQLNALNINGSEHTNKLSEKKNPEAADQNIVFTTGPNLKTLDHFFVSTNQKYLNTSPLVWKKYDTTSKLDYICILNNQISVTGTNFQDLVAHLNVGIDEANENLFKYFLKKINQEFASLSGAEGAFICMDNNNLLFSISGIRACVLIIRSVGKKGLKINGKQQLPKKIDSQVSLYEINKFNNDTLSDIKEIQLEKGDKIYFTTQSTYEIINQKGISIDSFLMKISATALNEQKLAISKLKSQISEDNSFIFIGGSVN